MLAKLKAKIIKLEARYHHWVVAFALVFVLGILSLLAYDLRQERTDTVVEEAVVSEPALTVSGDILPKSNPLTITIPKLNLSAPFEDPLGVDASREIEVPDGYDTVGYYKYGPTPGELGPAVVLGHVDSVDGPAVFYSLGQLEEGDEIEIEREDGTTAVFEVTNMERHLQSGFPTEQVYGNIDHAGLRLITCSGTFDKGIQRYSHNLIVFAELKREG